jgi:hypothetical protein
MSFRDLLHSTKSVHTVGKYKVSPTTMLQRVVLKGIYMQSQHGYLSDVRI